MEAFYDLDQLSKITKEELRDLIEFYTSRVNEAESKLADLKRKLYSLAEELAKR